MLKSQQWASDDGVGVKNRREAWHCREGRSVKKDADGEDFLFICTSNSDLASIIFMTFSDLITSEKSRESKFLGRENSERKLLNFSSCFNGCASHVILKAVACCFDRAMLWVKREWEEHRTTTQTSIYEEKTCEERLNGRSKWLSKNFLVCHICGKAWQINFLEKLSRNLFALVLVKKFGDKQENPEKILAFLPMSKPKPRK